VALHKFIFTHDTEVSDTTGHGLGDIIITQVQDFYGEIGGLYQQSAFTLRNLDASLSQQGHCVLEEATLGLYGNAYHSFCV